MRRGERSEGGVVEAFLLEEMALEGVAKACQNVLRHARLRIPFQCFQKFGEERVEKAVFSSDQVLDRTLSFRHPVPPSRPAPTTACQRIGLTRRIHQRLGLGYDPRQIRLRALRFVFHGRRGPASGGGTPR